MFGCCNFEIGIRIALSDRSNQPHTKHTVTGRRDLQQLIPQIQLIDCRFLKRGVVIDLNAGLPVAGEFNLKLRCRK
jgi:hypothetical protein